MEPPRQGSPFDAALRALLVQHPGCPVGALDERGLTVPLPATLEAGDRAVITTRSALDLVVPGDRVVVIDAWQRAQETGASRAVVRLRHGPETPVALHFFDVRAEHGAFVVVVLADVPLGDVIVDALPTPPRVSIQRKSELAVIQEVDDATLSMLGLRREEIVGAASLDFVHPDDHERAIDNWMDMLAAPGGKRRCRLRYRHADGRWIWLELTNHNRLDDPGWQCVVTEALDVADEMAAYEALRSREQVLDRIAQTIPLGLVQIDTSRRIVYSNERALEMLGLECDDGLDTPVAHLLDEDRIAFDSAVDAVLTHAVDCDVEARVERRHAAAPDRRADRHRLCHFRIRALTGEHGGVTGAIVCVEDITDRARLREELERRATFDALTGCLNRASVIAALEAMLWQVDETGRPVPDVGVVFVDLDEFKQINDRQGHAAGDAVLVEVAARIRAVLRVGDHIGRLGGDEFLVVCPGVSGVEEALRVAFRISDALADPVATAAGPARVRASIGVATAGSSGADLDAIVAHADAAMYASKARHDGRPVAHA